MPETITPPQWPDTEEAVTADVYAQWLTVSAYYRLTAELTPLLHAWEAAGLPREGALRDAYVGCVSAASAEYGLAYMLRSVAPQVLTADELALTVHVAYDGNTEQVIDYLESWLEEYGIDPTKVADAVEADRAARLAASKGA